MARLSGQGPDGRFLRVKDRLPSEPKSVWGVNVHEARKRLGLSRESLAQRVGVNPISVWKWETGVCAPTVGHVFALAHVLGVPVVELFPVEVAGN